MKTLWTIFAVCFIAVSASAACPDTTNNAAYVRTGASGSNSGADWTNAYTGFGTGGTQINPASMTRGCTYYVATGSYGAPNFSTAVSGTTLITVASATVGSHGTATGWSNAYAGVVTFTADTVISTGYWTFTGQSFPSGCMLVNATCGTTGYNLYFHNTTDTSTTGAALDLSGGTHASPQTGVSIEYAEIQGINNGTSDDSGVETQCAQNTLYVGYSYIHDVGVDLVEGQFTCTGQNYTGIGATFEYNYFAHNHRGDATAHAQAIANGFQNLWVRYNVFYDIGSSGCITDPFPGVVTLQNWAIYGNTYMWDTSFTAGVGDGLVGLFGETMNGYFYVVNNTLAYINNSTCATGICNSPALFLCGSSCGSSGTPSPAIVENNLWWNPSNGQAVTLDSTSTWNPTADYNQAYCPSGGCSFPGAGGFTTQGAHDLQSNTGNPFVNFDGVSNFNVSLAANTSAGNAVAGWSSAPSGCTAGVNCLNDAPLGITRGANGTIDRGMFQIPGGGSSTGGSGGSIMSCVGFVPTPCSRTDTALNYTASGISTNGPTTPFTSGPTNTVFIDPYFGNRVVRVTNGSTASNHLGDGYQTASAGWARQFNCAGTHLGPSCPNAVPMTFAEHLGGGVAVWSFDRGTLNMTRADTATNPGGPTIVAGDLPGPWFDAVDPLKLFYTPQATENPPSQIASWNWYEFNLASPGSQTSNLLLNINTGAHAAVSEQQTGSGGVISAFNGLINYVAWPAAVAPSVCDGTNCYSGTPQTAIGGSTCGNVSGGATGSACITVSTTGGAMSGKVSFAVDQNDAGTPPTEQNISAYGGIGMANWPWTTYNFTGNAGEITAVTAPTQSASPATAADWNLYAASSSLFGTLTDPQTKIFLGPRQFQVPIATSSCSGAGGTGGCPSLPYTTLVTTVTASNPTNRSCAPTTASVGKCILQQAMQDNSGTKFVFLTGGLAQGQTTLFGVWDTTKGMRYIDTSTGVVTNGATDANGNACPAVTCWGSTGAGPISFHGDPNDTATSTQAWGGMYAHEAAITLDGNWVALGNQISPGKNDSFIWWDYNGGNVYMCSQLSTAASCAGHPGYGYNYFVQTGNGQPPIDGNLDERGTILSATPCSGSGCAFVGTPYIQQISTYSLTGPCTASAPPNCAIPAPNFQSNGYDFIGSGRADSHQSLMDENPTNTLPYALVPYSEVANYQLSATTNSQQRSGCPSACVYTFTTSGSTVQYFAGDHIQITGMADNTFNVGCYVTSTGPTSASTKTFTCVDPTHPNVSSGFTQVATPSSVGGITVNNAFKIESSSGRAGENEFVMVNPAQSSTIGATFYRIAHVHFDLPATGAVTGPNGSVSPDGHYGLFVSTDGSGGVISNGCSSTAFSGTACVTLGDLSGDGGVGYSGGDTGTINNAVTGATLATYTVNTVSGGAVTALTINNFGTLYTSIRNIGTTATSGAGTGLILNLQINSNQTAGGRSDVIMTEIK